MKDQEYDYNGHLISYTNDRGGKTVDYNYLAAKQAKAITNELNRNNSESGGGGIVELNEVIVNLSTDPDTGKLNVKEYLKNSGLIWGIFALSFILVILLIVGVICLVAWLTSGHYHPLN